MCAVHYPSASDVSASAMAENGNARETSPLRKYGGIHVSVPDATDFVTAQEDEDLKRGLSQRHIV